MSGIEPRDRVEFRLCRDPPFVEKTRTRETERDHKRMAVIMSVCAVAAVLSASAPAALAVLLAWIGGYHFNNWLVFEDAYEVSE
jgi:hypothetical protein